VAQNTGLVLWGLDFLTRWIGGATTIFSNLMYVDLDDVYGQS
jgi:hypothetical protein